MSGHSQAPLLHSEPSDCFSPDDIELMRRAFHAACEQLPLAVQTEEQRTRLAQAIILTYRRDVSEISSVLAAVKKSGEMAELPKR